MMSIVANAKIELPMYGVYTDNEYDSISYELRSD